MTTQPGWATEIGNGLVMRGAVPEDVDRLVEYNADMHREPGHDGPAVWIGEWTRDLLTKPHPTTSLDDIIVVEESATGRIVSSTVYFNQTWCYEGVSIPVGRPELVSTHPDFRRQGLIRRQFDLMHQWGRERDHLIQGITGIPYYYRQFGYEMALEMEEVRTASVDLLPEWKEGEERAVRIRKASTDDLKFITAVYKQWQGRSLVSASVGEPELRYKLFECSEASAASVGPMVIEDGDGWRVGFVTARIIRPMEQAWISRIEFEDATSWRALSAPLLKEIRSMLVDEADEDGKRIKRVTFLVSKSDPLTPHLGREFIGGGRPYAWYVRLPDVAALLRKIGSVLADRLKGSSHEGLSGEVLISFYKSGVKLVLEGGTLTNSEAVAWPDPTEALAHFPDLTFLQMVFGRKSFGELHDMFVDCAAKSNADADLMDTLFPKRSSNLVFAL